jgi:acylphosphatase
MLLILGFLDKNMTKLIDKRVIFWYHLLMIKKIEIVIGGSARNPDSFSWMELLAARLSIQGSVFTRPDGSIRVTAEGEEQALQTFAKKIEQGHVFSHVENFFIKWSVPTERSFNILVSH